MGRQSFGPFGEEASGSSASDNGKGLLYFRNRMYSPLLGRFISEDPMGWEAGSNFFAYCHNDPVNFNDPLGLWEAAEASATGNYSDYLMADAAMANLAQRDAALGIGGDPGMGMGGSEFAAERIASMPSQGLLRRALGNASRRFSAWVGGFIKRLKYGGPFGKRSYASIPPSAPTPQGPNPGWPDVYCGSRKPHLQQLSPSMRGKPEGEILSVREHFMTEKEAEIHAFYATQHPDGISTSTDRAIAAQYGTVIHYKVPPDVFEKLPRPNPVQ